MDMHIYILLHHTVNGEKIKKLFYGKLHMHPLGLEQTIRSSIPFLMSGVDTIYTKTHWQENKDTNTSGMTLLLIVNNI